MTERHDPAEDLVSPVPTGPSAAAGLAAAQLGEVALSRPVPRMRVRQLLPVFVAQFTLYVAFVAPTAFSLAVRVGSVAPDSRDYVLALAVGIPGIVAIFLTPMVGVLSDRTRSRLGRRRPWLILGGALGLIGASVVGLTDSVVLLVAGWLVAFLGYTFSSVMILAYFGDHLPASQRGRVMGINGTITQVAPIAGITLAGAFAETPSLMFLAPGLVAFLGLVVFIATMHDRQVSEEHRALKLGALFQGFWFSPRRYPNIAWVWLSKALVFCAIAFMQIYSVYLLTTRLGMTAAEVAVLVALVGTIGIPAAILGALGSGWLSDKLGTRKPFLIVSALVLGAGLITIATAASVPQYIIGSTICSLAIGIYGAVDQALQLDVLPDDENQNGRFLSTLNLANQVPQAIGPFAAAAVLFLAGGEYGSVYWVAALFAVLGAAAIIPISLGRRATLSTTSVQVEP
ncbi:MFS transporter [Frigoribacterium salinisoli]